MISYRGILRNVRKVADQATEDEVAEGRQWYPNAYTGCQRLAEDFEIPVELVADLVATTSPNLRWERNISLVAWLLAAHREGRLADFIGEGYQRQVDIAKEMLVRFYEAGDWAGLLSGPKVTSFANCILNYSRPQLPVVDVHSYSAAVGQRYTVTSMPTIHGNTLWNIRRAYTEAAAERGFLPQELQAVTWLTWRRLGKEY